MVFMDKIEEAFAVAWKHHQAGEWPQAEQIYRDILQADAGNARTWFVLGTLYQAQSRLAEAIACFQKALHLKPAEGEGYFYLGNAFLEQGKFPEAQAAYEQCVRLVPEHGEAWTNLGVSLGEQGRLDAALLAYRRARELRPQSAEVHYNLGNALRDRGKHEEALACYQEALRLKPDYGKASVNLGLAQAAIGLLDDAVATLQRALDLGGNDAETHNSMGAVLSLTGRLDAAIAHYQKAIERKADYAEAHWNLALAWLVQGDFRRGWPEYEWRLRCKQFESLPAFAQPRWDGSHLIGRRIVLTTEQGLGDTLQFIRYARLVKERGGTVVVQCQKELVPLLRCCSGIDQLVPAGSALPEFAYHAPLLSLPAILGTTLDTTPAEVPYVRADPHLVEHWRRELAQVHGFRVGIAWQGNPKHPWDRHRSIPLACFEPLARIQGVRLISLQRGPGTEQLAALHGRFPVLTLDAKMDENGAFLDTAAVMQGLDLIVTSDTAIPHLAGALARPVWMALSFTPDWRWLRDREDSPWYPTLRLFRQGRLGDWKGVMDRMAQELTKALPQVHEPARS
jgi:tetratricopeptide (TPR) repeat protein